MALFAPFRITDRRTRRIYHHTQLMSLVPVLIILALMAVGHGASQPGLWCALGIVLGAELILTGAYRLHTTPDPLTKTGVRLAERLDAWFPFLLFVVQHTCWITAIMVLWFAVQSMGLTATAWQNTKLIGLVIVIPTRRVLQEAAGVSTSGRWLLAADLTTYVMVILVTWLIADALTPLFADAATRSGGSVPSPLLIIWTIAILIFMASALMIIGRLRRGSNG